MFIKRLTAGFLGIAVAGMLVINCEKMNGPLPEVSEYRGQLLLLDGADASLAPAVQINTIQKLIVNDAGFAALLSANQDGTPREPVGLPMATLKKIVFQ